MDTTNEPVAWMLLSDESCVELTEWFGVMRGWEDFLGDNEKIVELYAHPVKELTDEEIYLVREVLNGCVSSIKAEIDQELQTFKGYEHCSNLPSLESELKDAEKAIEILRKAQNG